MGPVGDFLESSHDFVLGLNHVKPCKPPLMSLHAALGLGLPRFGLDFYCLL